MFPVARHQLISTLDNRGASTRRQHTRVLANAPMRVLRVRSCACAHSCACCAQQRFRPSGVSTRLARANFLFTRPRSRRDYPPNLSISLSGGKETNKDSPSSGERNGKSPAPNPACSGADGNVVFGRIRTIAGRPGAVQVRLERGHTHRGCQARSDVAGRAGWSLSPSRVA